MFRSICVNATFKNGILILNNNNIPVIRLINSRNLNCNKFTCLSKVYIDFQHPHKRLFCSSIVSRNGVHKISYISGASPNTEEESQFVQERPFFEDKFESINAADDAITYIPPPPAPPEIIELPLNALGEQTFSSLGLGGWSPIGLLQNSIEFLHVSLDIPWWGAIALTTLVLRMAMTPLVVLSQRNAAKMQNRMPKIMVMQTKLSEARLSGNHFEAARISFELQEYMKKNDINPLKNVFVPLLQAPIFISMFIGLRRCTNLPVESFQTGGMLWFPDLTITDPYWLLPLITCATMFATIEVGTDGKPMIGDNAVLVKYVLRAIPLVMFPFILNFPAGILCYWVSTNFFSLGQVAFLKIPVVRNYFKIEQVEKVSNPEKSKSTKGFIQNMKESYSNMQLTSEIRNRHNVDEIRFKKAGTGPLIKTYKENPLVAKKVLPTLIKRKDQTKFD